MNRRGRIRFVLGIAGCLSHLSAGIAAGIAAGVAAAATKTFHQSSAKDFEEGEMDGTTILPTGEIVPGLTTQRLGIDAAFVWCSAVSRDGRTVYWGTGDDGKVFAQSAAASPRSPAVGSGEVTRGATPNDARLLAKLDAPWVTAMVTLKDGRLLAATTPGGHLVTIDPRAGDGKAASKVQLFATLAATHIWALAYDERSGVTYAATGLPGKIFAIDGQGRARQLWDSRDQHVVSLWMEPDGTLLAGTSDHAILYRVFADGRAEALQDFDAEEVRAITHAPSGLYVAVNDFEKAASAVLASPSGTTKGTKVTATHPVGVPPSSAGALPRPGARKSKAGLYRIDASGRIEQVFSLADGYLTTLLVDRDGAVWVTSGAQGRVHRVLADGTVSLIIDVPERQILTLIRANSEVWLGTGDAAAVYVARTGAELGGRYLSKVLDAEYGAAWGALQWQGNLVSFETRSGNTAKPDADWRAWTAVKPTLPSDPARPAPPESSGHVASAPARFLQYRATLRGKSASLRGVTTYFVPQNQRARITEITSGEPSGTTAMAAASTTILAAPTPASGSSRRESHSPVVKLRWKVDNPDGDELVYRLWLRTLNGAVWRPLAGLGGVNGEPLTKPEWEWNTESLPDGHYVVRVVASDERSQPAPRALSFALDSQPMLIDNGRPEILQWGVRYPVVSGRIADSASAITAIEMAIDGGEWTLLSPVDGIADERQEQFSITLPRLLPGPHAVAIRATDSNANVGAIQIEVNTP
jgi:hypothetical protein